MANFIQAAAVELAALDKILPVVDLQELAALEAQHIQHGVLQHQQGKMLVGLIITQAAAVEAALHLVAIMALVATAVAGLMVEVEQRTRAAVEAADMVLLLVMVALDYSFSNTPRPILARSAAD